MPKLIEPYWASPDGVCKIYHGDCLNLLPKVGLVDAVVTSPPYAEQRADTYGGVPETEYPKWMVEWASKVPLKPDGSLLVNIKEHRGDWGMSDYVHRSRMLMGEKGWCEVDELLWIKPDPIPTGPNSLPRRGWERILWFSKTDLPYCQPLNKTKRLTSFRKTLKKHFAKATPSKGVVGSEVMPEYPRVLNYVSVALGNHESIAHPAVYPEKLAAWMVALMGETILDPFMGSGTTGIACLKQRKKFIGIERDEGYCALATKRLQAEWEVFNRLIQAESSYRVRNPSILFE